MVLPVTGLVLACAVMLASTIDPVNWAGMVVTKVKPVRTTLRLCWIWLLWEVTRGLEMLTVAAIDIVVLRVMMMLSLEAKRS